MRNKYALYILITVLIGSALAARFALFQAGCANMPAVDDECIIALQAKQIANGNFSLLMLAQPYMFPLEAYLMAPIIDFLPRTALGARTVAFGLGLLSLLFGWLIIRRWGSWPDVWPGILLLCFGAPFLQILQYGIALPGYPSLIFLSTLIIWLAQKYSDSGPPSKGSAFIIGILGGLACSVTMLALPVVMMAGAMIGLHRSWRLAVWTAPLFILGAVIGFTPQWLANYIYSGTNGDVFRIVPWRTALARLLSPTLDYTLPAALGMGCPIVPGSRTLIECLPSYRMVYGCLWLILLTGVTLKALQVGWARWWKNRWLSLDAGLVFAGVSWLCLAMFLFGARSASHTYRYLTLAILAWPFLMGYYYCHAKRRMRWVLGGLTLFFLTLNLYCSWGLLQHWRNPAFGQQLGSHDLKPVINYLNERGIRHAYSVYADAYRLTYATDERIMCAQLYNERFPTWPLPFKEDLVDPATHVAYVLSDDNRFTAGVFEGDLNFAKVSYRSQTCGAYKVYTDFVSAVNESPASPFSKVTASHGGGKPATKLNTPGQFWRSEGSLQSTGMWISVEWSAPRQLRHILMKHGVYIKDYPGTVQVYYLSENKWIPLPEPLTCSPLPFRFKNGHPIYGGANTHIELPSSILTSGIKLEIVEPRIHQAWTIYEIASAP